MFVPPVMAEKGVELPITDDIVFMNSKITFNDVSVHSVWVVEQASARAIVKIVKRNQNKRRDA